MIYPLLTIERCRWCGAQMIARPGQEVCGPVCDALRHGRQQTQAS